MTRINVVPVAELTRQHLIAEYRELPRVFGLIREAQRRGESPVDIRNPLSYTLGTGHVRFFYNKIGWLVSRYYALVLEMRARGYHVGWPDANTDGLNWTQAWDNFFEPTPEALEINRKRILDRLGET